MLHCFDDPGYLSFLTLSVFRGTESGSTKISLFMNDENDLFLVDANSPNLCPIISSVISTGTYSIPLCTRNFNLR